jgi:hypothetical protein
MLASAREPGGAGSAMVPGVDRARVASARCLGRILIFSLLLECRGELLDWPSQAVGREGRPLTVASQHQIPAKGVPAFRLRQLPRPRRRVDKGAGSSWSSWESSPTAPSSWSIKGRGLVARSRRGRASRGAASLRVRGRGRWSRRSRRVSRSRRRGRGRRPTGSAPRGRRPRLPPRGAPAPGRAR